MSEAKEFNLSGTTKVRVGKYGTATITLHNCSSPNSMELTKFELDGLREELNAHHDSGEGNAELVKCLEQSLEHVEVQVISCCLKSPFCDTCEDRLDVSALAREAIAALSSPKGNDDLVHSLEWLLSDYEGMCTEGFSPSANWPARVAAAKKALGESK